MKKLLIILLTGALCAATAHASGTRLPAKDISFSFEGPFGKFDRAQLQRGYQVYKEVCASCHSLNYVTFRELGEADGPGFSEAEVKSLAAESKITDGPDSKGEMFERSRRPSDHLPAPYASPEAATAILGAYPPDLSLITKARSGWGGTWTQLSKGMGGPEYVYSLLTGYEQPPEHIKNAPAGKHYNPYFVAGNWISMPAPLTDGRVTYSDGTPNTVDQMSKDVAAFLAWTAEPRMVERKRVGFGVMIFLASFAVVMWFYYKRLWKKLH